MLRAICKALGIDDSSRVGVDMMPTCDQHACESKEEEDSTPTNQLSYEDFLPEDRKDRMPQGYSRRKKTFLMWDPPKEMTYPAEVTETVHHVASCRDAFGRNVPGRIFFYPPPGTRLDAGLVIIEATFVPLDDSKYKGCHETREIFVNKRQPHVSWTLPFEEIVYLTPIGQEIFDGLKCEINGGTWEYSHKLADVLPVGKHKLCAEYIPSTEESRNYSKGYAQVILSVVRTRIPLAWTIPSGSIIVYPSPLPPQVLCAIVAHPEEYPDHEGIFTYEPPEGTVLPAGEHVVSCTFTPHNTRKYFPSYTRQTIVISPATPTIVWNQPVPIPAGDPLSSATLCASNILGLAGRYEYLPPAGSLLTEGEHSLEVRFWPEDPNYSESKGSVVLRVYPKRQLRMQWFDPEPVHFPCALSKQQLNASLFGFGMHTEGQYIYTPDFGTILSAGRHVLTCRFEPVRQSFLPAVCTVELEVRPCTVRLLWRTPDPLLQGEGLFDSVLNCQVSFPYNVRITSAMEKQEGIQYSADGQPLLTGHFEYTPSPGTVLDAGVYRLKTKFVPDDPVNYTSASAQVEIIIRERPKFRSKLYWSILHDDEDVVTPSDAPVASEEANDLSILAVLNVRTSSGMGMGALNAARAAAKLQQRLQVARDAEDAGDQGTERVVRELVYGEPLDADILCAECTNAQGRFDYSPPMESMLDVGEHVIEAAFVPDAVLSPLAMPSSLFARIRIVPRVPILDWKLHTESGEIPYGIPLDRDYRRAMAVFAEKDKRPVAGNYFYQPLFGTILDAGPHILKIRFEPHDELNFTAVEAQKEVFVQRCFPRIIWDPPSRPLIYPTARLFLPQLSADGGTSSSPSLLLWPRAVNDELPDVVLEGNWEFSFNSGDPLPAGEHQVSCKFYPKDIINYYANSLTIHLSVLPAVPAIVWTPDEVMDYETPLSAQMHCCAMAEVPGLFEYDPPVGTIMSASGKALIKLTFTPEDTRNYQTVSIVKRLEVRQRVAAIDWPLPRRMPYGTVIAAEHLCASLSDTENTSMTLANLTGCTFTYSPAAGEVPKAGNRVKFVARMTPPDAMRRDYAVVDKVVEVEIFRTPPPITWKPKVTNLFDGEALTTQHLCAFLGSSRDQRLRTQAIYPGTLSYAPPVGTILGPPGRHPVVVTFTPAQPENALTTSITLNFDINKRAPKVAWIKDPVSGKMVCVKSTDDNRGSKHS